MNLKQLSHMLELSQTTVSRALNGYPEVGDETRRRVVEAARRHGYRPNPSARKLATGKAGMIGYVWRSDGPFDIDPVFGEFVSGLGNYARLHQFAVAVTPTAAEDEEATYHRVIASKEADAVYVSAPTPADRRITLLHNLGFPYIVHGRSEGLDFEYPYMDIDNESVTHQAGTLLIQLGHRRIALINGESHQTFAIFRERGLRRAMETAGLKLDPGDVRPVPMTEENGYRAARALMNQQPRPTAIFCSSLFIALGTMRALAEMKLAVPTDVSVVAHDDVFAWLKPESFAVPLSTTRSSIRAAGERIAERLIARISGTEIDNEGEVWPVDLVVRGSIAGAPA